jgi:hypothetical protein
MTTVGVNGRTVVHKGSGGFSIAPVDVCKTPPDAAPVPYINQGLSADAADEASTVYAEGHRVMIRTSCFATSTGDEPGSLGGIISGTFKGKASFANFSYDVLIEGQCVPRALDPMVQNHGSPANAFSPAEIQPPVALSAWEIICAALCACKNVKPPMQCFRMALAEMQFGIGPRGAGRVWDPYHPGIWVEVAYGGHPPSMIPSANGSKRHTDEQGNPLPLPAPDFPPIRGSSRPDVVVTIDPRRPPQPGNIARVYEVKFPGDRVRKERNQLQRYYEATGVWPKVVTAESCGCGKKKREKAPVKDPAKAPGTQPAPEPGPFRWLQDLSPAEQIILGILVGIILGIAPKPIPVPA